MHPAPAGLGEPVLTYRPQVGPDRRASPLIANGADRQRNEKENEKENEEGTENKHSQNPSASSSAQPPSPSSLSTLNSQQSTFSITPLPEIVTKVVPSLHCTTGTALRIDCGNGVTIHTAFFEWDREELDNVMEAFRHMPEECMGSIGMTLTAQPLPKNYKVGDEILIFDHTVFRDQIGATVNAFKCTWVSGTSKLLGDGVRGSLDQKRQILLRKALQRFNPAYARVVQGAVRGIPNPDQAWKVFEDTVLADLSLKSQ